MCLSTSKKLFSIMAFLLFLASFPGHTSNTRITACDPCSEAGAEYAAKSLFNWNEGGVVYVVDFDYKIGYKFNIYIDYIIEGPDEFPVHKATQLPLSSDEIEAFEELFFIDEELKVYSDGYTGSAIRENLISQNNNESLNILSDTGSALRSGYVNLGSPPSEYTGDFNAHNFMINSSLRQSIYQENFNFLDAQLVTSFNFITNIFDLGAFLLKDVNLGYRLYFPDGSYILVFPDFNIGSLRYVEGSAFDSDGNRIPSPYSINPAGSYDFTSPGNYESMRNYMSTTFGAQFPSQQYCTSLSMTCTIDNDGNVFSCVLSSCEL